MEIMKNILICMPLDGTLGGKQSITNLLWWNICTKKEIFDKVPNDFNAANPDIAVIHALNSTDDNNRLLKLLALEGTLAGYPTGINAVGMLYRKDIFWECGLHVQNSFQEFENVTATLKFRGYTPMVLCGLKDWHTMFLIEALLVSWLIVFEYENMYLYLMVFI